MSPEASRREFHEWLEVPVVTFGDASIDVADLVLLALRLERWAPFAARVREGVALQSLELAPVPAEQIRARATQFRYAHGLVSAADFTEWLSVRSLRVADLSGVITRGLLCEREAGRAVDDQPDTGHVLWAEMVCGGLLFELASAAGDRLAAAYRVGAGGAAGGAGPADGAGAAEAVLERVREHPETGLARLGEVDLRARALRLEGLERSLAQLRDQVDDDAAIGRCLVSHRLDWLQISGEEVALPTEGAAREARLLVMADGLALADAAARARVPVRPRRLMLESTPADASTELVAAASGELIGPWLQDGQWRLMRVADKRAPSMNEPELRRRAIEELLRDVLDRTRAGRVQWTPAVR